MVLLAIFGSYVFTSLLLLKYPNLIHKRKKLKFKCCHISHRGGAGENYENTMTAFRRAVECGTHMLELDCHLTRDGQVVVSHDHNLLRTTGVDRNVSQLNYKDFPLLRTELSLDFDPGHVFVGSGNPQDRKFALLKEVFQQFPNVPINIDIKVDDSRLIREVSDLIKHYDRQEITVWGNFSDSVTQKCYQQDPQVNLFFSMRRVVHLVILLYTGLLPFVSLKETHLEILLPSIYLRRKTLGNMAGIRLNTFIIKAVQVLLIRKILFEHLKKRGIQTYFWVLNYEDEFKAAFELGAAGVMTDYPARLTTFLNENPQYKC